MDVANIDISKLSIEECKTLYNRLAKRHNQLLQEKRTKILEGFRINQPVCFNSKYGEKIVGTVTKINRKTCTVATKNGNWRVSASLLKPV